MFSEKYKLLFNPGCTSPRKLLKENVYIYFFLYKKIHPTICYKNYNTIDDLSWSERTEWGPIYYQLV